MKFDFNKILNKRKKYISDKQFVNILSAFIGLIAGTIAVVIKNSVYLIQSLLNSKTLEGIESYFYFLYPILGISLAVIFIKFVIRKKIEHGIPGVLYSISEKQGYVKRHNLFSSIITSALTVGSGGSVGLEGPTVATGSAYGSLIGKVFKLNFKQTITLLGAASTAAMSAIFKAPISGIVFALEVIMIDLTVGSVVPLLIASITAVLTSYLFMGPDVLYHVNIVETFKLNQLIYLVMLGIFTGLVSVYFTKVYIRIQTIFSKFKSTISRLVIAGSALGLLIFLFPALYGEGYEIINNALEGNINEIYQSSIFSQFTDNYYMVFVIILAIILLKTLATSLTFAAGGIGGIFAPTLFMGALSGMLFAITANFLGYNLPIANFALVGMAGTIAGVLQAPLTAIFLIAEISGGYQLLVPIMLVSLISYITTHSFIKNSVYTHQLAATGKLMTHNADKNTLKQLRLESLIESDFKTVNSSAKLGDLVKAISESNRNVFAVVDDAGKFVGEINLSDIRKVIFKPELYDKVNITKFINYPDSCVSKDDTMEEIAQKLHENHIYNIPVIENSKFIGCISRANFFAEYRKLLSESAED
jgi:CIC family chloride channel protein